jgi:GT2 family glycosyltransferase
VPAPDLTVVVLSYETRDLTLRALRAVEAAAAPLTAKVVCVDNASRDGSAAAVRAALPGVVLVENATNLGFARGNAVALPHLEGRVAVFLNGDTVAAPGSLAHVVRHLDARPEAGIAAPRLVSPEGTPQRAAWPFPTPLAWIHQYTAWGWLGIGRAAARRGRPPRAAGPERGRGGATEVTGPVDAVSGACLAIRRDLCLRLEGFDPGYPHYVEDVDLCWRAKALGAETHVVVEGPPVTHVGGASAAAVGGVGRLPLYQGMLRFARKRLSPARARLFSIAFKPGVLLRVLVEALVAPFRVLGRRLAGDRAGSQRVAVAAADRRRFLARDAVAFLRS